MTDGSQTRLWDECAVSEPKLYKGSVWEAFIAQEAIALYSRDSGVPVLHGWVHERALLVGARETTLPQFEQAACMVAATGCRVVVRPFGGLAVPLDAGVLNVTLAIPGDISLDEAYRAFVVVAADALAGYGEVEVGEVAGSYCPGRFDLRLNGVKVAGVAQRRLSRVTMVSAFVNVYSETVDSRLDAVKAFYDRACENAEQTPAFVPRLRAGAVGDLRSLARIRDGRTDSARLAPVVVEGGVDAAVYRDRATDSGVPIDGDATTVVGVWSEFVRSAARSFQAVHSLPAISASGWEAARQRLTRGSSAREWDCDC